MFFDLKRIIAVREMILADDTEGREAALAKLLPMQRGDFHEIFRIMAGLPVTIRLLDPPLHEFIPHSDEEIAEVARAAGADPAKLKSRAIALAEANPMLGHRGCRLGITYPEIYEMQARAILEASLDVQSETGKSVELEIMVPLIGFRSELDFLKDAHRRPWPRRSRPSAASAPQYLIGTMIELPRAALMAGDIAQSADFFSFGTNDLTQTALGVSRDDAASFLSEYLAKGLIERDPFVSLDRAGVGELVQIAVERGRQSASEIEARHLRRTRRRSGLDPVLPRRRASITSRARRSAFRLRDSPRPRRRIVFVAREGLNNFRRMQIVRVQNIKVNLDVKMRRD